MGARRLYLLPNLFTSGSVLCGFWSLVMASQGRFAWAAWLILSCHLFDAIDGSVARLTNTTSRFGAQYDSLADMIGFGVAPSFLVYQWAFADQPWWGWLCAVLFVTAGAVRLARFNAQIDESDPTRFVGLPIPVAATILASTVLLAGDPAGASIGLPAPALAIAVLVLSALMVSRVPYRSFKDLKLRSRKARRVLAPLGGALVLLVVAPSETLFVVFTAYALSGPVEGLVGLRAGERPPVPRGAGGEGA